MWPEVAGRIRGEACGGQRVQRGAAAGIHSQRTENTRSHLCYKAKHTGTQSMQSYVIHLPNEQHGSSSTYHTSARRQAVDLLHFTPNTQERKNIWSRLLPAGSGSGCASLGSGTGTRQPRAAHESLFCCGRPAPPPWGLYADAARMYMLTGCQAMIQG